MPFGRNGIPSFSWLGLKCEVWETGMDRAGGSFCRHCGFLFWRGRVSELLGTFGIKNFRKGMKENFITQGYREPRSSLAVVQAEPRAS